MRLENSELRAFQAVIEANGFNRAADRLHISQSAVSQAIANLENKLGTSLVVRGKQLGLTEAGRRLLEHASEVLREEQQVLEDIARIKRGDVQVLNLAVNSAINRFYAPQLVSRFARIHTDTQINVAELPSRNLIYEVLAGRVELGLGPFQKHMEAFDTLPLFQEFRHLVVGPRHPNFEQMISGDNKVLKQSPLITSYLDNPAMRPAIARIRDRFKTVWEVSSLNLRIHLVAEGQGAAFIDQKLIEEHPLCRDFSVMRGVAYSSIERQAGIYYKAGRNLSSGAKHFIALCQEFWGQPVKANQGDEL